MMIHIPLETPSKKNSRVGRSSDGSHVPQQAIHRMAQGGDPLREAATRAPAGRRAVRALPGIYPRRPGSAGIATTGCLALTLLVDCGVLQDDNWMVVSKIVTTNLYDKGNPGVNISIIPLTDSEKLSRL